MPPVTLRCVLALLLAVAAPKAGAADSPGTSRAPAERSAVMHVIESSAPAQPADSMPIAEALKKGVVSANIVCGAKGLTIRLSRENGKGPLSILIPAGTTPFGFVNNSEIRMRSEWDLTISCVRKTPDDPQNLTLQRKMVPCVHLTTDDLAGDGFRLTLLKDLAIPLTEETSEVVDVAGRMEVNLLGNFEGFPLSKSKGRITAGELEVARDTKENVYKLHVRGGITVLDN